jgi:hypothetical protein
MTHRDQVVVRDRYFQRWDRAQVVASTRRQTPRFHRRECFDLGLPIFASSKDLECVATNGVFSNYGHKNDSGMLISLRALRLGVGVPEEKFSYLCVGRGSQNFTTSANIMRFGLRSCHCSGRSPATCIGGLSNPLGPGTMTKICAGATWCPRS